MQHSDHTKDGVAHLADVHDVLPLFLENAVHLLHARQTLRSTVLGKMQHLIVRYHNRVFHVGLHKEKEEEGGGRGGLDA